MCACVSFYAERAALVRPRRARCSSLSYLSLSNVWLGLCQPDLCLRSTRWRRRLQSAKACVCAECVSVRTTWPPTRVRISLRFSCLQILLARIISQPITRTAYTIFLSRARNLNNLSIRFIYVKSCPRSAGQSSSTRGCCGRSGGDCPHSASCAASPSYCHSR